MRNRARSAVAMLVFAAVQLGAADRYADSVAHLRAKLAERLGAERGRSMPIPFELNPEILARARQIAWPSWSSRDRSRRLIDFMVGKGELNLVYDSNASRTAVEVYEQRAGNCLSLTSLYVGMARAISLDACYVHVTEVTRFSETGRGVERDGVDSTAGVIVKSSHICAGLKDGLELLMVDFSPHETRQYRAYEIIDDAEALAHYFNNKGYETAFRPNDLPAADRQAKETEYYQTAIAICPDFFPAYNNLGTAYRRHGDVAQAMQLYSRAIEINPRFAEAYSNRAAVYLSQGRSDLALAELTLAATYDDANPYVASDLGNIYYGMGRFRDAEDCFKRALSRDDGVARFYEGLVKARLAQGRRREALAAAEECLRVLPDSSECGTLLESLRGGGN